MPKPLGQAAAAKYPPLINLRTIKERTIEWLWYPYIPAASASMLFGPGGRGKSHITVDLAARVTNGEPFPGQDTKHEKGNVLMLSAEDEFGPVLVPRLRKAKADLTRVLAPERPFTLDSGGLVQLARYIDEAEPALVTVDPIVSYMGGKIDMNKANEVRVVIGGLHQMAIAKNVPILIVQHQRKGGNGEAWEGAMGSADFTNAVRSSLWATRDKETGEVPILRHVKSNYGPLGNPWEYTFGDEGFDWVGPWVDPDPAEKTEQTPEDKKSRVEACRVFLQVLLQTGPMPSLDILAAAMQEGFNSSTVNRAKVGLVESFRSGGPSGHWQWRLIGWKEGKAPAPIEGALE